MTSKKKLLIIALSILGAIALLLAAIPLLEWLTREPDPIYDFEFADPSLSADIYADPDYMDLDRSIYYVTSMGAYDFETAIGEGDYTSYNKAVQLLIRLVLAVQAGDDETYNSCFSPEYIAKEGKQPAFTMQKVYDIRIQQYAVSSTVKIPAGYKSVYAYGLRYRIKDNNGSLRNDMDSDGVREQYFHIVLDENDVAWVYGIQVKNYRPAS